MRLERGTVVEHFSYEEWLCARYMWIGTSQRTGVISYLFQGSGDGDPGLGGLRAEASPDVSALSALLSDVTIAR